MAQDMKATGKRARQTVLEDSSMSTEIVMKVYGVKVKLVDRAFTSTLTEVDTLASFMQTIRMVLVVRSGPTVPSLKVNL